MQKPQLLSAPPSIDAGKPQPQILTAEHMPSLQHSKYNGAHHPKSIISHSYLNANNQNAKVGLASNLTLGRENMLNNKSALTQLTNNNNSIERDMRQSSQRQAISISPQPYAYRSNPTKPDETKRFYTNLPSNLHNIYQSVRMRQRDVNESPSKHPR